MGHREYLAIDVAVRKHTFDSRTVTGRPFVKSFLLSDRGLPGTIFWTCKFLYVSYHL